MWIFFEALIFQGHLVYVILSDFTGYMVHDFALDYDKIVRICLVGYCQSDVGILLHVAMFDAANRCVDQYEMAIGVDPSRCYLWRTIWIDCCQVDEVFAFKHFSGIFSEL